MTNPYDADLGGDLDADLTSLLSSFDIHLLHSLTPHRVSRYLRINPDYGIDVDAALLEDERHEYIDALDLVDEDAEDAYAEDAEENDGEIDEHLLLPIFRL
jgi:hypothetical protein